MRFTYHVCIYWDTYIEGDSIVLVLYVRTIYTSVVSIIKYCFILTSFSIFSFSLFSLLLLFDDKDIERILTWLDIY